MSRRLVTLPRLHAAITALDASGLTGDRYDRALRAIYCRATPSVLTDYARVLGVVARKRMRLGHFGSREGGQ